MLASGWPHSGFYRGIAIKKSDRDRIFDPSWRSIVIETEDGLRLEAPLTDSFWQNCSEVRYGQVGRCVWTVTVGHTFQHRRSPLSVSDL